MSHRHPPSTFPKGIRSRKQGGRVAVVSDPQHHEIKPRPPPWVGIGYRTKHVLILPCSNIRIRMLSSHAMDTILKDVERTKERCFGEMVIAVRMVRRRATLIAEKEVRARPLLRRVGELGSQSAIHLLGSPASGQCEKESASLVDRLLLQVLCQGGGLCGPLRDVVQDMHFVASGHRMNLLCVRWSITVREDSGEVGGYSGRTFASLY